MRKKQLVLAGAFLVASFTLIGAGCTSSETTTSNTNASESTTNDSTDTTNANTNDSEGDGDAVTVVAEPGEVPFDFPATATTAKVGEYVLAPPAEWVEEAFVEGADNSTFIYYSATVEEVGAVESTLTEVIDSAQMPNAMMVALPAGETAAVGDVVLTWWQSGSGMQRGYVVDATNPATPEVLYLDIALDNPATTSDGTPIAEVSEELEADSFITLDTPYQPGTAVAVDNNGVWNHYQVINEADGKLLVIGFAGVMDVVEKADAVALPIIPDVQVGDAVMFPLFGAMDEATVSSIDTDAGRVYVEYEFAGSTEEEAVPYGDIIAASAL